MEYPGLQTLATIGYSYVHSSLKPFPITVIQGFGYPVAPLIEFFVHSGKGFQGANIASSIKKEKVNVLRPSTLA